MLALPLEVCGLALHHLAFSQGAACSSLQLGSLGQVAMPPPFPYPCFLRCITIKANGYANSKHSQ